MSFSNGLQTLVREYGWIHTGIGAFGNVTFVVGSVLFLPRFEPIQIWGTWAFIVGATLMLVGSVGNLVVKAYEARERRRREHGESERSRTWHGSV